MKHIALLLVVIAFAFTGCTQPDSARKTLEQAGYTNIEITGYRAFMAGENDTFSTGFKAIGPTGKPASGAVTGAWLKGNTIRLD